MQADSSSGSVDNRQQIEQALVSLALLLNDDEEKEEDFQKWFEQNDLIFQMFGYVDYISQPLLTSEGERVLDRNGNYLKPDFVAQRPDGLWEIVELKRPSTKILKHKKNREDFYQSLNEYISQCENYAEYFDDASHRQEFEERYKISIQKGVPTVLIAGRSEGLDMALVHKKLFNRGNKIRLHSYDEVYARLEMHRLNLFGDFENIPGITIIMMIYVFPMPAGHENFILDIGTERDRNRISIFVDSKKRLCFRIYDDEGDSHIIRHKNTIGSFSYNELMLLSFEVGLSDEAAILTLDIDGKELKAHSLTDIPFTVDKNLPFVMGSDNFGKAETNIASFDLIILDRILAFSEKSTFKYLYFTEYKSKLASEQPLRLRGKRRVVRENHPNFHDVFPLARVKNKGTIEGLDGLVIGDL